MLFSNSIFYLYFFLKFYFLPIFFYIFFFSEVDIGFQGPDPATDFRGAGYLGLLNLHYFIKYHNSNARLIWETSIRSETQYFFCSAGLYITIYVWGLMQNNKLNDFFFECANVDDGLEIFGKIYAQCFISFNDNYRRKIRSLMDFNKNIVNFQFCY